MSARIGGGGGDGAPGPPGPPGPPGADGAAGAAGATGPAGPDTQLVGASVPAFASPGDDGKGLIWQTGAWTKVLLASQAFVTDAIAAAIGALTKGSVGLGNVDNTSDANKPVSTAQATALAGKQAAAAGLTDMAGLSPASNNFIAGSGTNWIQRTSAQTVAILQAVAWAFTQGVQFIGGSTSAVAIRFSATTNTGIIGNTGAVSFVASGTTRGTFGNQGLSVTGSITPTGAVNSGLGDSGATLALSATSPQVIEITDPNAVITLAQTSWSRTTSPIIRIRDPLGIATGAVIMAFDDGSSNYNSINEYDAVAGAANPNGVWSDVVGGDGPGGNAYALTPGHEYEVMNLRNNPGASGAIGGYTVKDLGPCM